MEIRKIIKKSDIFHNYIVEELGVNVKLIESVTKREGENYVLDGYRVSARISELNRNSDGSSKWRTPAYEIEHSKVFIIDIADFTKYKRDKEIDDILDDSWDVEDELYTGDQIEKIEQLRVERRFNKSTVVSEKKFKQIQNESFLDGDPVWFKDSNPAIIIYKHDKNQNGHINYTVKTQDDVEHKYVSGEYLKPRTLREEIIPPKKDERGHTDFWKEVKRLSDYTTEELIKRKNKKYYIRRGETDPLMYVLQSRPHHTRKKEIKTHYTKSR